MNVYEAKTYIEFLEKSLHSGLNIRPRGKVKAFAEKLQSHPTFVSQVLRQKAHLSHEQAVNTCIYFQLDQSESEFFIDLLNRDRAGSVGAKLHFQKIIDRKLAERKNFYQRTRLSSALTREQEVFYFSRWAAPVAHAAIHIPEFRNPEKLARALQWDSSSTLEALKILKKLKLAEEKNGAWNPTNSSIHISKDSPLTAVFHGNWRTKTAAGLMERKRTVEQTHFSSVFAITAEVAEEVREILLRNLEIIRTQMVDSEPEILYAFCMDFYPLGKSIRK